MKLSEFEYELPKELIAHCPVFPRHSAKMLVENGGNFQHQQIIDFPNHFSEKDLIIFNNSKVIPAALNGKVLGHDVSFNLHKHLGDSVWSLFAKPSKRMVIAEKLMISEVFWGEILERKEFGECIVKFNLRGKDFFQAIAKHGKMPLPPYIIFNENLNHEQTYQTIFAQKEGSVAAPTAGLHFTTELFENLAEKNIKHDFVTLHVGGGTFLPVRTENVLEHKMHYEECEISENVAEKIRETKRNGGKIVAVGTTSLRILEAAAANGSIEAFQGETNIFIIPGHKFQIVDSLLTNFHLPKSTLLMLVSAFSGYEEIKNLYDEAIKKSYRFFSYGDCCLLNLKITK